MQLQLQPCLPDHQTAFLNPTRESTAPSAHAYPLTVSVHCPSCWVEFILPLQSGGPQSFGRFQREQGLQDKCSEKQSVHLPPLEVSCLDHLPAGARPEGSPVKDGVKPQAFSSVPRGPLEPALVPAGKWTSAFGELKGSGRTQLTQNIITWLSYPKI